MVHVRRNLCVFFKTVQQFPLASTCSCSSVIGKALLLQNISQKSMKNQQNLMFIIKVSSGSWYTTIFDNLMCSKTEDFKKLPFCYF